MKLKFAFLAVLSAAIVSVGIWTALPAQVATQPAAAQQQGNDKYDGDCDGTETAGRCADKPFDHSNCQYPFRTTNPVDGCDNTDPCDPANAAKGGSGDCSDAAPVSQPVTTAPPSNQCGGAK